MAAVTITSANQLASQISEVPASLRTLKLHLGHCFASLTCCEQTLCELSERVQRQVVGHKEVSNSRRRESRGAKVFCELTCHCSSHRLRGYFQS